MLSINFKAGLPCEPAFLFFRRVKSGLPRRLFHHVLRLQVSLQDRDRRGSRPSFICKKSFKQPRYFQEGAMPLLTLPKDKLTRPLLLHGRTAHEQTARSD
jgi:hypothetical protein